MLRREPRNWEIEPKSSFDERDEYADRTAAEASNSAPRCRLPDDDRDDRDDRAARRSSRSRQCDRESAQIARKRRRSRAGSSESARRSDDTGFLRNEPSAHRKPPRTRRAEAATAERTMRDFDNENETPERAPPDLRNEPRSPPTNDGNPQNRSQVKMCNLSGMTWSDRSNGRASATDLENTLSLAWRHAAVGSGPRDWQAGCRKSGRSRTR
jgi:hypothetical protein